MMPVKDNLFVLGWLRERLLPHVQIVTRKWDLCAILETLEGRVQLCSCGSPKGFGRAHVSCFSELSGF